MDKKTSKRKKPTSGVSFNLVSQDVKKRLEDVGGELGKELAASYEKGESVPVLTERIKKVTNLSDEEAEALGRYHFARAFHESNIDRYKRIGIVTVRYIAVIDNRTCPKCKADHNKLFNINKVPEIPRHDGCRCMIIPE